MIDERTSWVLYPGGSGGGGGGTSLPEPDPGDILYADDSGNWQVLHGNSEDVKKFLMSVGDGATPYAPTWQEVVPEPAEFDLLRGDASGGWDVIPANFKPIKHYLMCRGDGSHPTSIGWDIAEPGTYCQSARAVYATSQPQVMDYVDSGIRIPEEASGMIATGFWIRCDTAPTGTDYFTVQIKRERSGTTVNMLTRELTIDPGDKDSAFASLPCIIDTNYDDLQTGDYIYPSVVQLDNGATARGLLWGISARIPFI